MTFPKFKRHALSKIFPDLEDDEMQALADDIKANGLHEAIVLYKGEVLDGWHRYQACYIAEANPRTIDYKGKNPAEYVESKNSHRRHMTTSQRAFAKVQLSEWHLPGAHSATPSKEGIKTSAEMAVSAKVGVATIERAKVVVESGSAALKDAVKTGEITITKAAAIAKLPKREQAAAMKEPLAPPAPTEPEYTPLDEANDKISELQDALVLANMEGAPKEKDQAKELIASLRAEIKTLEATLKAVKLSRDTFQTENAAMKAQITRQRKEIDKITGKKTA